MSLDIAINSGLFMDGSDGPALPRSIGIKGGVVTEIRRHPFNAEEARELIDARGHWVTPGFIDVHTHYDAEVEASPSLSESLRHGVTTVFFGSCSLGVALSGAEDIADMFTRVEAVPREHVLPLFEKVKDWETPKEYIEHLQTLPLGPNVAAFLGHSDLRCKVMGLGPSVTEGTKASRAQRTRMKELANEALDAGMLGLSFNTNKWDKLGGDRHRSLPLPSTFARWPEILDLANILRERGSVLQTIPNISAKYDAALFALASAPWQGKALKTSIVSMVDVRSNRQVYRAIGAMARLVNGVFGADFRVQALPVPFEMFVDGLDAPVFEEFGAGTAALHLEDMAQRRELLHDEKYRSWFRKQWTSFIAPKVFHRDFAQTRVIDCPDPSLIGRSFEEIGADKKTDVVEAFLDAAAEHGDKLRWFTTIGNDRPDHLRKIMAHPDIQVGFADSGAHLRNMAFYNFPLFFLRMSLEATQKGIDFLTPAQAVHRLTGEIADWYGIEAGHLAPGKRADIAVINPDRLDYTLDEQREAPMPEFGGFSRMVRRNDQTVPFVLVNGKIAMRSGKKGKTVGAEQGFGTFLKTSGTDSNARN